MSDLDVKANDTVKRYALYAAGAGLIPMFTLDIAAIGAVELKMIAELAKVYGVPFEKDRVRPIVSALIGGYLSAELGYGVGGSMLKGIPLVGSVLGMVAVPAFGSAVTYAIGRVFIQHFAAGGTFLDFDPEKVRAHFHSSSAAAA